MPEVTQLAEHAGRQGQGASGGAVIGHFNLNSDWRLEGWCCWPDQPTERPQVEITVNGRVVSSCIAVQLNDTLRQSGIGDGRYGFSLAPPAQIGTAANGEAIVEARERRTGTVLGRVIFHAERGVADRTTGLDRLAAQTQALFDSLKQPHDTRLLVIGGAFERLGQALLVQQHMAAIGATRVAHSGLERARAKLGRVPSVNLDYSFAPDLSIVFLSSDNCHETLAAIRHALAAMSRLALEVIVLDDGGDPRHQLLHTVVPAIRLIRHFGAGDYIRAVNDALRIACGRYMCFVGNARDLNVQGVEAVVQAGSKVVMGGVAGRSIAGSAERVGVRGWTTPKLQDGVTLLAPRQALMAAGGFAADTDSADVDWLDLQARLAVLGYMIDGWSVRKPLC